MNESQPAQTQVALTDDARECLADIVSHYRALYAGLAFQLNEATVTENGDDMAYWKHEIRALERMYAQAERALLAAQPVSGGKSSLVEMVSAHIHSWKAALIAARDRANEKGYSSQFLQLQQELVALREIEEMCESAKESKS